MMVCLRVGSIPETMPTPHTCLRRSADKRYSGLGIASGESTFFLAIPVVDQVRKAAGAELLLNADHIVCNRIA